MAFAATIRESSLDDFVLHTRKKLGKDVTDIVTPAQVVFKQLERKGAIEEEEPGQGPVEPVTFVVPDRITVLSRSDNFKQRNLVPIETATEAQYDWVMLLNEFTIDYYTYRNAVSPLGFAKYVERQLKVLDQGLQNKLIDYLWNGHTSNTDYICGLKDMIQFDPTSDPTRGSVGRISVSDISDWANQYANYNTAFATYSTGVRTKTMLTDGSNSWQALYLNCSNNPMAQTAEGQPDLILVNTTCWLYLHQLHEQQRILRSTTSKEELGVEGFAFQNATVVWDPDVPDDPNDSTYGVAFFVNTDALRVVFATGNKRVWSELRKLDGHTGWSAEEVTQFSMTCKDRRKHGVHFGQKAISVS